MVASVSTRIGVLTPEPRIFEAIIFSVLDASVLSQHACCTVFVRGPAVEAAGVVIWAPATQMGHLRVTVVCLALCYNVGGLLRQENAT